VSSSGSSQSVPAMVCKYVNAVLVMQFKISHVFSAVESQCLKSSEILKFVLVIIKWLKLFCCYNSYDVLYGGRIYNLHVDAVIVSARYAYIYVCV